MSKDRKKQVCPFAKPTREEKGHTQPLRKQPFSA